MEPIVGDVGRALANMGKEAADALPTLRRLGPTIFRSHIEAAIQRINSPQEFAEPQDIQLTESECDRLPHATPQGCLENLIADVRHQPIAKPAWQARQIRRGAMRTLLKVSADPQQLSKIWLERMFFDDSAALRSAAAQALMEIDKELASEAKASEVLDRLGPSPILKTPA